MIIELNANNELALLTKQGVIKRVLADYPAKESFEVITLREGDELVGAILANGIHEYVLVSSDAQVLRFKADSVRAQGRAASGITGFNLADGARAIALGSATQGDEVIVVTAANSSAALVGTDPGTIKASALSEFPTKGRATGGVRGHKFLRNEDQLYFASVSGANAVACSADGRPLELPELARRDASGTAVGASIAGLGSNEL